MPNLEAVKEYWECGRVIGALLDMARDCADKDECAEEAVKKCIKMLKDTMPTIDPESLRPNGRWEEWYMPNREYVAWDGFYCSVCGKQAAKSNYCPNCGADMRGESND